MTSFVLLVVCLAVAFAAAKFGPELLRTWRDHRRLDERSGRAYAIPELPRGFGDGEKCAVHLWTHLAGLTSPGHEVELNYDFVGTTGGIPQMQVVLGYHPGDAKKVKAAVRRAYRGQATFRVLAEDPFDELHERVVAQRAPEPDAEPVG